MTRSPLHILLIEDSPEDCADMRQMLLQGGRRRYIFSEARLGAEGVCKVFAPEHGPVDCVLLDYALPDIDAPDVLVALCQGNDMTPCPVVVITGSMIEEGRRLIDAGAQDYISKRWTNAGSLTRSIENAIDRFALQCERRRISLALGVAKAEAEAANQAKSDFLLRMSHELRTPLNVMLGYTQLIESGSPTPTLRQQNCITQILKAGWYLLGLMDEVLELSSIHSSSLPLHLTDVLLDEVLSECEEMIRPQAHGFGIQLKFPVFDAPCHVQADASRTKQVLLNLLTNAVKYNRSPGHITVRCTAMPGPCVRVSVEDVGHGLSQAQLAQLFQLFNRLGQETNSTTGTGMGLVISKQLVELMGGRFGVESQVGVGSCFWFELQTMAPPYDPRNQSNV